MKQWLLMNRKTGEFGAGVKISFFQKWTEEVELVNLDKISIGVIPTVPDGWIVKTTEDAVWVFVTPEMVDRVLDVIGEI